MKKHANIPIFIPHMGCKNDCVFCNQRRITGRSVFDPEAVRDIIESALKTMQTKNVQIAFFGGSFTGIDEELMIKLLSVGKEYIDAGYVSSLRCSTRPDYINERILDILHRYGMRTVELGIQSTSDEVLAAAKRGHVAKTATDAMKAVSESGFELIGQMMIGLPSSTLSDELKTAEDICTYAHGARIYPTVVFKDTALSDMTSRGEYTVLTSEQMLERTVEVKKIFIRHKKPVIRVGLNASESLVGGEDIAHGEFDESVGERAESLIYREIIDDEMAKLKDKRCVEITVPTGCTSRASGMNKSNKIYLKEKYGCVKAVIKEDASLPEYSVKIREVNGKRCT